MPRTEAFAALPAARDASEALAAGLPFLVYVATASGYGHWLDAGEFVAQAEQLGISHPPGHPLAGLVLALARFLPLGPMAFRVALVSAASLALACVPFHRIALTTARAMGVARDAIALPLAVGATWAFAFAPATMLQAVRPEVYALQAMLVLFVLDRLVHLEDAYPSRDLRAFYAACLAFGLALANHHFLALLLLPAAMPTVARVVLAKGRRPVVLGALLALAGLLTYAYLPLRARARPPLALGMPDDLARFLWVVRAEAFQKNTGDGVPQPMDERIADVLVLLAENLHVVGFFVALAGLYVMVRRARARRVGTMLGLVLAVFTLARAWLGFARHNPDAAGYMVPAIAAAVLLAVAFAATLLTALAGEASRPRAIALVLAGFIATGGLAQVARAVGEGTLTRFTETDAFDESLRRALPTRAVVIAFYPQTTFRFIGGEAEESLRPDVSFVPVPFLAYPGMVESLVAQDPELAPVLRSFVLEGALSRPDLQTLASRRPVLVELDPRVPPALYDTLTPGAQYFEVFADGVTEGDERAGARARALAWGLLERLTEPVTDDETRAQIVWRRYNAALYFAGFGDREAARAEIDAALALSPTARELVALRAALDDGARGPIDVTRFVVGR